LTGLEESEVAIPALQSREMRLEIVASANESIVNRRMSSDLLWIASSKSLLGVLGSVNLPAKARKAEASRVEVTN